MELIYMTTKILNNKGEDLLPSFNGILRKNDHWIDENNDNYISLAGDRPAYINRWLLTSETPDALMDFSTEPYLQAKYDLAYVERDKSEVLKLPEDKWYYFKDYNRECSVNNKFEKFYSSLRERYIYGFSYIFCTEGQDILLYINNSHNPLPTRIWVNGKLVFFSAEGFLIRRNEVIVNFNKGSNFILVERKIIPQNRIRNRYFDTFFTLGLKPVKHLLEKMKNSEYFDPEYINYARSTYAIITQKVVYLKNETLKLIILPQYFAGGNEENINITLFNSGGNKIFEGQIEPSRTYELPTGEYINGAVKIMVESVIDPMRRGEAYILMGDYDAYRSYINSRMEEKSNCDIEIKHSISKLLDAPNFKTGLVNHTVYPLDSFLCFNVFKKCWEFERYLNSDEDVSGKGYADIFDNNAVIFMSRAINGTLKSFNIFLPKDYSSKKKYPLVIQSYVGYGIYPFTGIMGQHIHEYLFRQDFGEAVVAIIPCIPENYSLNELLIFHDMINDITTRFSIDCDRISLMGICRTSLLCTQMLKIMPHNFSSAALISPNINRKFLTDELYLNTSHVQIYHLNNIGKALFLIDYDYNWNFKNIDFGCDYDFEHEEFTNCYNSIKLIRKLAGNSRTKFPKKINFSTSNPAFCRSYWLKINCVNCLDEPTVMEAEIAGNNLVRINARNTKCFSIYIDKVKMELQSEIVLSINDAPKNIGIRNHEKVTILLESGAWQYSQESISPEAFDDEYNHSRYDENSLGIHQVYLNNYLITSDDDYIVPENDAIDNLYLLLDRVSKVTYEKEYLNRLIPYTNMSDDLLRNNNIIYVIHPDNIDIWSKERLQILNVSISSDKIVYNNQLFSGRYFAFIKQKNPHNHDKLALFVVYNAKELLPEMDDLLMKFEDVQIFFNDVIIYNKDEYFTFRSDVYFNE